MMRRRDPDRLRGELGDLFADVWQLPRYAARRVTFRPAADSFRSADPPRLTVVVELAGVDPDEVEVIVRGRALVVAGARRRPTADGRVYQQIEIDYGPFRREILLTEDVDTEAATASYAQGLLTIELPVAPPAPAQARVPIAIRREP
jgi:HSP20 family protein